ncbi:MAG: hypothetical protein WCX65_03615 [bacterium]
MGTKKKCFVIMPFSKTQNHDEDYWTKFFDKIIQPKVETYGYFCEKSKAMPQDITDNIIYQLKTADLVIAVLTDNNPNVMYELGIRHTLKRGTILIIQKGYPIPSYIQQIGVIKYELELGADEFYKELSEYINSLNDGDKPDSPVIRALGTPNYNKDIPMIAVEDQLPNIKDTQYEPLLFKDPTFITAEKNNYEEIDSNIIKSDRATIAVWVYVNQPNSGIRRPGSHHIFGHDTNKGYTISKEKYNGYINMLFLGHINANWEFGMASDVIDKRIDESDSLKPGWHHFIIRWSLNEKTYVEILIDGEINQKTIDLSPWPKELDGKITIGTWTNKLPEYYIETYLYRFFAITDLVDNNWITTEINNKPDEPTG